MPDIIQLLPESIANQIAAGEVIQRPASVVKELMENSVDAHSSEIRLIIKNSGKSLIQVVDNGQGMSEMDARMCFERHATSKIKTSEDLFTIRTKGFRGEALASIAAIAQVELKTKQAAEELGVHISIEGSELKKHESCSCTNGTSISVKNLFFNVPARRKFLKSDPVELRHILNEFQRISIAHPDIFFSCYHNDNNLYHLITGNLRQRIVGIFGKQFNQKVIPVYEETDFIKVEGFVGKPEFAKKTRGEQFFFVNNRYIKSNYFAHAVKIAYESMIPEQHYPNFFLFIYIDPAKVDINVHPTKQEVKFEEERLIYNYIKVSVKQSLGQYSLTPIIDFDQLQDFDISKHNNEREIHQKENDFYFKSDKATKSEIRQWESIYSDLKFDLERQTKDEALTVRSNWDEKDDKELDFKEETNLPFQVHNSYIICQIKTGLLILDQQAAHERILYEKLLNAIMTGQKPVQQELFPQTIDLDPSNSEIFKKTIPVFHRMGFEIEEFGSNSYIIRGVPAMMSKSFEVKSIIEIFLEQYISNVEYQLGIEENIARSIAYCTSIRKGKHLEKEEMESLIDQLFACEIPFKSPSGKKCFITEKLEDLQKKFND